MTEESKAKSLIEEARGLLSKATKRPWQCGGDYWTNKAVVALYGTSFVAQCSASDQGEDDPKFIARAPEIISQLCNELDQQVSLNKTQASEIDSLMRNIDTLNAQKQTQAESLSTCHDRMKLQKEAIEFALRFMGKWFGEHAARKLPGDEEVMTRLRHAITAKGEQSS